MGRNSKVVETPVAVTPPPAVLVNRQEANGREGEVRERKIAGKALKGFEILIKLSHQLYKSFMLVFAQQMEVDEIKGL